MRRWRASGVIMVMALVGAACGSDDPGGAAEVVDPSEAGDEAGDEATNDSTGDDSTGDESAGDESAGDESAGSDVFCAEFNSFLDQMVGEWSDSTDPTDPFLGMLDVPGGFRALLDAIGEAPNDEVASALDVHAEAAELIETADLDDSDAIDEVFEFIYGPEVTTANETVAAYVEANCDIELDTAATSGAGDDGEATSGESSPEAAPVADLDVELVASWQSPATGEIVSIVALDDQILAIEELDRVTDTALISIDPSTGDIRSGHEGTWLTSIFRTDSGALVFEIDACGFRPISLDDLSLGAVIGDLSDGTGGCSGVTPLVRGNDLWVAGEDLRVVDSLTGDTLSLAWAEVFGVDDEIFGFAVIDIGDAVLASYFDDLGYYATRVDDDLVPGPVVRIGATPTFIDGQLTAGSDILDPVSLEVIGRTPSTEVYDFEADVCVSPYLFTLPAGDGTRWVGPHDMQSEPGEFVVWLCSGGERIARTSFPGEFTFQQWSPPASTTDEAYYFVLGNLAAPGDFSADSWDLYRVSQGTVSVPADESGDESGEETGEETGGSTGTGDGEVLSGEVLAVGGFTAFPEYTGGFEVNEFELVFRPGGGPVEASFAYTIVIEGVALDGSGDLTGTYDPATRTMTGTAGGEVRSDSLLGGGEGGWSAIVDPAAGTIVGTAGDEDDFASFELFFPPYVD